MLARKVLRRFYITFAHLYGVINFENAYMGIKAYHPEFTKAEFRKDLAQRANSTTRDYQVYRANKRSYIIADEFYDFDEISELFKKQGDMPIFIEEDEEKYLSYADYYPENDDNLSKDLRNFIQDQGFDDLRVDYLTMMFLNMIQRDKDIKDILDRLEKEGIILDQYNAEDFTRIYLLVSMSMRKHSLRGNTFLEVISTYVEPQEVMESIREKTRQMMLDETIDPYQIRDLIEKNDEMSFIEKEDALRRVNDIIEEIENSKA